MNIGDIEIVDEIISLVLSKFENTYKDFNKYQIIGIYLNYYEDGNNYTPNHSHPNTHQLIISLGSTRELNVGKKKYEMNNSDAIIFGSSVHGVPKADNVKEGRISIATFMIPL